MPRSIRPLATALSAVLAFAALSGCAPSGMSPVVAPDSPAQALGHDKPLTFVTIQAQVAELLPDDNHGLPHQNFVVKESAPQAGLMLTVNHDTKYGKKVAGLKVGDKLTIRGVLYHNGHGRDGIHWTHHKDRADDAGFIKTADGTVYQ
jgi:hypothetical protein